MSSDLLFATLSNEIEDLISRLTTINSKMSETLNTETGPNSNATVHTLQVNLKNRIKYTFLKLIFNILFPYLN